MCVEKRFQTRKNVKLCFTEGRELASQRAQEYGKQRSCNALVGDVFCNVVRPLPSY